MRFAALVTCATVLAAACGAEFMPSVIRQERRVGWEDVLVLEQGQELSGFRSIGTVIARARKSKNAVAACRKEAAKNGGEAIVPVPLPRGGEWKCSVLQRAANVPAEAADAMNKSTAPRATTTADAAKGFMEAGKEAFENKQFEKALRGFEFAYLLTGAPAQLYNIATTLERLNRFHEAAVLFSKYATTLDRQAANYQMLKLGVQAHVDTNRQKAGGASVASAIEDAKRANAAGKYAFEHKDYDTAIAQFMRAFTYAPTPALVFNIGVALEATSPPQFVQAATVFDRFLEIAGPPADEDERQSRARIRARADADRSRR